MPPTEHHSHPPLFNSSLSLGGCGCEVDRQTLIMRNIILYYIVFFSFVVVIVVVVF